MANLQYIGARYVPIVFTNPDNGTSDWKNGVEYEALTIVTVNGDSYTSKRAVPRGIGTPPNNPTYWVKTGDFNASLVALQQSFQRLEDNVNAALDAMPNDRKFVLIGDSFSCGIRGGGQTWVTGWANYFESKYPDKTFWYNPASDTPFEGVSAFLTTSDKNFIGQLNYVHDNKLGDTDPDEITDVIVIGGTNEPTTASAADIANYIAGPFKSRVNTLFPNANIKIGCFGLNARYMKEINHAYDGYYNGCLRGGIEFLDELFNLGTKKDWDSGAGHLTELGYNTCNPIIAVNIIAGHCSYSWFETYDLTLDTTQAEVAYNSTINYAITITVSDKGVSCRVYDKFRYRSYPLIDAKDWSGSGGLDIVPFTFNDKLYTWFTNNQSFDNVIVFNINTHGFDSASGAMTITANSNNNGASININTLPANGLYSNKSHIAFDWDGASQHILL